MQQQSRWVSLAMSASMAAALVVGGSACQGPDGACADNTDCAFGQTCRADQCVATLPGTGGGGRFAAGGRAGDGTGDDDEMAINELPWGFTYTSPVPAALQGNIGNADVRDAFGDVFVSASANATTVNIADRTRNSTFILVTFGDPTALRTPGRVVAQNQGFASTWAQACNYDTASYDETFPEVTVEVGEVRPATPGEVLEVDGTLPPVVDVVVTVDSSNTAVVGSAVVPVLL